MYAHSEKTDEGHNQAAADHLPENKVSSAAAFQTSSSKKTQQAIAHIATMPAKNGHVAQQKSHEPAQLFQDMEDARRKGTLFRVLSNREYRINQRITGLVQAFQSNPTRGNHELMMVDVEDARKEIKALHVQLVALVDEYEKTVDQQEQLAYFEAYLEDKPAQDRPGNITFDQVAGIFNRIMARTIPGDDTYIPERNRFLMYMMQGLTDNTGIEQYQALDQNLGGRNLVVNRTGPNNMSGGLENFNRDNDYSKKMDDGGIALDSQDLTAGGGTGIGLLRSKFSRPYNRTPNPQRGLIGNVQINMDRGDELMPIMPGMEGEEMKLFSPPKKMGVHHEIGHINSMLEGVSGSGKPMTGVLSNLTDQEEMFNIYGGPRSDRAYGRELGLPERFSHGDTLVTYFGLDPGAEDLTYMGGSYDDFMQTLSSAGKFLSPVASLGAEIKRLVDSNWAKITKGIWRKPDGVKAIKKIINLNVSNPDLVAIKHLAQENRNSDNNDRHPFTRQFYETLADMEPEQNENLKEVFRALRGMTVPQTWE